MNEPSAEIVFDLTFPDYQKKQGLNHSILKLMARTPAHARCNFLNTESKPPTAAMRRGNLVQEIVQSGTDRFARWEGDRRTKQGKEDYALLCEKLGEANVVSADAYDQAVAMANAIKRHPTAGKLWKFDGGEVEPSLFWHDDKTNLLLKGRPDLVVTGEDNCLLIDLKTTEDASPEAFQRKVWDYSMHTQLAYYRAGLRAVGKHITDAILVACEDQAPYGVAVYRVSDEVLSLADGQLRGWLEAWARCVSTGEWPCYADEVVDIGLPAWAVKKIEQL